MQQERGHVKRKRESLEIGGERKIQLGKSGCLLCGSALGIWVGREGHGLGQGGGVVLVVTELSPERERFGVCFNIYMQDWNWWVHVIFTRRPEKCMSFSWSCTCLNRSLTPFCPL